MKKTVIDLDVTLLTSDQLQPSEAFVTTGRGHQCLHGGKKG